MVYFKRGNERREAISTARILPRITCGYRSGSPPALDLKGISSFGCKAGMTGAPHIISERPLTVANGP